MNRKGTIGLAALALGAVTTFAVVSTSGPRVPTLADIRVELVRANGFNTASETQLTKVLALSDTASRATINREVTRARGFVRASSTQLKKTIAMVDSAIAAPPPPLDTTPSPPPPADTVCAPSPFTPCTDWIDVYICAPGACDLTSTDWRVTVTSKDWGPGATYAWDLGVATPDQPQFATGQSVNVRYPHEGERTVKLTVTLPDGTVRPTISNTFTLAPKP